MLNQFKPKEKLSASKLNAYKSEIMRNHCFGGGTVSPQGFAPSLKNRRQMSAGEDESIWSFGMDYQAGTATVYAGDIYFDGAWRVSETTPYPLQGTPCYIYASMNRISYAVTIKHANTKPGHTPSEYNLLLAEFTANGTGYTLTRRHHKGAKDADAMVP